MSGRGVGGCRGQVILGCLLRGVRVAAPAGASFEKRIKKVDGKDGYIDLLWKAVLLIKHKSLGKDLDRAHTQARDYFHGLTDAELPRYLLVSDFVHFRFYDLNGDEEPVEFALKDLWKHIRRFGFIAGYQPRTFKEEDLVKVEAAERMGNLPMRSRQPVTRPRTGSAAGAAAVLPIRRRHRYLAAPRLPRTAAQRTFADGANLGRWLAH